jgi:hypothetical protein
MVGRTKQKWRVTPSRQTEVTRHRVNPSMMRNGQMILTSYDFESDTWTHHNGENPARKAFREAVEAVTAHAREKLPQAVNGRIDAARKIVLQGDVELLPDDKARVSSQTHGTTTYHIVDGTCDCRDFAQSPDHWCKHRIAYGIYKRASALAKEQLQALDIPVSKPEPVIPPGEAPVESEPVTPRVELPTLSEQSVAPVTHSEAPVSLNCHLMLEGRQVQVTLRGTDESVVLHRLITLLQQYPVAQPPTEPPTQGTGSTVPDHNPFCHIHKVPLKKFSKHGRTWYSHKKSDGSWCRGK